MKNFLLIIGLIVSLSSYAQASFQGKISYNLTLRGDVDVDDKNELPDEIVAYYKDGKMRLDMIADKFNFHIITNMNEQNATFMMELKEEITLKMAFKTSKNELKQEFEVDNDINTRYTKERKTIAGYRCKKVILDSKDGEAYAYVTEDLNAENLNWVFDETIRGTIMELVILDEKREGIILKAKEVRKMNIPDAEFTVPSDYMVITQDGLKGLFGEDGLF